MKRDAELSGALGLAMLGALASGCTDFPTIPSNECGNGVIEAQEDCDTSALGKGTFCRPKGTVGECHLDCSVHDGVQASCPAGWGCDTDSICHVPTGQFEATSAPADVGAWTLAAGDFDGDGRGDVMSLEPLDSIGATRLRFYYFDAQAELQETRQFPKLVLSPVIENLSAPDRRSDVVFSSSAVGVMLGREDRSWVPETFGSFRVPDASLRVTGISEHRVQNISPILPLITLPSGTGFYVPDLTTGKLTLHGAFGGTVANLAGNPVSGDVLEDPVASPCLEPVLAELGSSHLTVVNVCTTGSDGEVTWRAEFEQTQVELEPRASIDTAPVLVDLDGDGHLDVLVGADGKPYVSYGDGQALSAATPYHLPVADPTDGSTVTSMPLAAGDFTGDGIVDFVFPDHLLTSIKTSGTVVSYSAAMVNLGPPWTSAIIADFNGNGKLDVVAATNGALNLQFFNGSGGENLTTSIISTDAPVASLAAGDFDGDLIDDIGVLEMPQPGETKSSLLVAFGTPFGLPSAPLTIAQLSGPDQLGSYVEAGLGNLFVTARESVAGAESGTLTLLDASSDRIPFAPLTLSEFASNGSVRDAFAISVAAGSFTARGAGDVVAIGLSNVNTHELWLVPGIEQPGALPKRLADLDGSLNPAVLGALDFSADITSVSADLDRDGRDEAVFAMPSGVEREQCGVLIVSAADAEPGEVAAQSPIIVEQACPDPQLGAADLDGDHFPDLILLTGAASANDRQLLVLWNDGRGGFSSSNVTLVNGDSVQAFTILPAAPASSGQPGLAYVTKNAARLTQVIDTSRHFSEPQTLAPLPGGTGIVASDVNGDGVVDLVLAASGKLTVLKAQLEVP